MEILIEIYKVLLNLTLVIFSNINVELQEQILIILSIMIFVLIYNFLVNIRFKKWYLQKRFGRTCDYQKDGDLKSKKKLVFYKIPFVKMLFFTQWENEVELVQRLAQLTNTTFSYPKIFDLLWIKPILYISYGKLKRTKRRLAFQKLILDNDNFYAGKNFLGNVCKINPRLNPAIQILGSSGSGKTEVLRTTMTSLLASRRFEEVLVVNTKNSKDLIGATVKEQYTSNDLLQLSHDLEKIIKIANQRFLENRDFPVLIVFDEALDVLTLNRGEPKDLSEVKRAIINSFSELLRKGRALNMVFLVALQEVKANALEIPDSLFSLKIVGRCHNESQARTFNADLQLTLPSVKEGVFWSVSEQSFVYFERAAQLPPHLQGKGKLLQKKNGDETV